jgi:anti-anti-sigma factor
MEKTVIKVRHDAGIKVVELLEEEISKLDEETYDEIVESLFPLANSNTPIQMLINLSRVRYFSSSMLSMLLMLKKKITESGGVLKLCSIRPPLQEVLAVTKLDCLFEIYENEEMALSSFGDVSKDDISN